MAVETLAFGYQNGVNYTFDHDNTAGTLGITITGNLHGQHMTVSATAGVGASTYGSGPVDVTNEVGQTRRVLLTNAALIGITLIATSGNASAMTASVR